MDWESYKTMPKSERVLVCYMNLWGYNHVTEAYWDKDEMWPMASNGTELKMPFVWAELPEGPTPSEWVEILEIKTA
jgi:hypothetical protein